MWQLNQVTDLSGFSCQSFSLCVATKPGHRPSRVLMPIFLNTTVTSRHDARLSSTTHCALRASRINYNLTNLSRCYSFLFFYYGPMQHPAVQPISFSYSFKCFLVILQALSLSLCQNHQTSCTTKLQISHATQLQLTLTCSSVVVTYFSRLPPLSGTLPIVYIWQIYHTAMGHRYFNLAMTCGTYPRYAHASHKSASAFRFPTL